MEPGDGKTFLEMEIKPEPRSLQELRITKHQAGRRIDRICRTLYKEVPLGAIMKAIRKGAVRLDGKRVKPDARPDEGAVLRVPWEKKDEKKTQLVRKPSDPSLSFSVIFQDTALLVANKPWGLLSQPNVAGGESLITQVRSSMAPQEDFQPALVHRLDRNTSGIILVALEGPFLRELHQRWQEGAFRKLYRAVVAGVPPEEGEIRHPLLKKREENLVAVDPRGVSACTRYRRVSSNGKHSLLEVELCTGRSHQIRVHLSFEGFPLVGDRKYGDDKVNKRAVPLGVRRPLLHAWSLEFPSFPDPWEHYSLRSFTCAPPSDFTSFFA